MIDQLLKGDRRALSKCITLCESHRKEHRSQANKILEAIGSKAGGAIRIGISGPPGVGKSTFIEAFGCHLIQNHRRKLAVLAIDPSSVFNKGSILGDKTRMQKLSADPQAFIRPSPSQGSLGGVARNTREAILLAEAAGHDTVLIETVGVGQSETLVSSMVDVFLMLQLPNSGDELQGIKKGILELADVIAITKGDGDLASAAKRAVAEHKNALHLAKGGLPPPPVICTSSLKNLGIEEVWQHILAIYNEKSQSGQLKATRSKQNISWLEEEVRHQILAELKNNRELATTMKAHQEKVANNEVPASVGADRIVKLAIEALRRNSP